MPFSGVHHAVPVPFQYISLDLFAAATSDGDVTLYRHVSERLEPGRRWDGLHHTKSVHSGRPVMRCRQSEWAVG